jgi:drug/metabolite transporter (DMT)-like permease
MALILAACSALFYGVADFSGGVAAARSRLLPALILSQLLGLALALAAVAVLGHPLPAPRDLGWGLAAGLTGSLGLAMLYGGLARTVVAIVSPLSALVGAMIPLVFGILLGERPPASALAGCALCLPAILLLSWERGGAPHDRRRVRAATGYGLLAGLGFGMFFLAISRCGQDAGLWPLVAARLASISACTVALLVSRQPFRVEPAGRIPCLFAGAADMIANILVLLAFHSGMLSLVAVVTSLFPAPTVLLARVVLKQRIPPVRLAGLVLALAGVGLISAK